MILIHSVWTAYSPLFVDGLVRSNKVLSLRWFLISCLTNMSFKTQALCRENIWKFPLQYTNFCSWKAMKCYFFLKIQIRWMIKSPRVTGWLLFLIRFRRRRSANTFQLSAKTPEANFFITHTVNLWGVGKKSWYPPRWSWVKLPKRDRFYLVPTIKWEPLIQSPQNMVGKSPLSFFPLH